MPSFFPPPFPFFRPNINYKQTNYPHNSQNRPNFNHYNDHNNAYTNRYQNEDKQNENISNFKPNTVNNNTKFSNSDIKFNTQKNSITNISNDSNTISSPLPFQLSNFLPTNIGPLNININGFTNMDEPIFELFGIHLFLDDIIIICILIFLFQEDVKDEMLFIILIMLLFS